MFRQTVAVNEKCKLQCLALINGTRAFAKRVFLFDGKFGSLQLPTRGPVSECYLTT